MSDTSTPRWALPETPISTDDDRLALIAETTTRLSDLAVEHPIIVHLLSMVAEEANHVRMLAKSSAGQDV